MLIDHVNILCYGSGMVIWYSNLHPTMPYGIITEGSVNNHGNFSQNFWLIMDKLKLSIEVSLHNGLNFMDRVVRKGNC